LYNFYVSDRKITRAFVVARKRKQAFYSLAPRSLVNLSINVYLSQNDYPVFFRRLLVRPSQEIKRFVHFTQEYCYSRFLYYFCLCKSFKELFLLVLHPDFWAKASAKVLQFLELPKLFGENF